MSFVGLIAALSLTLGTGLQGAPAPLGPGRHDVVATDGVRLNVEVAGHGPPCLFVHGGPGQGFRSFRNLGGESLESFLTIAWVDQRGSGLSAAASDYGIDRISRDFDEVRSALGADKVCLIAHSFGGMLAVDYATRFPSRVSSIVMVNASLDLWGPDRTRMEIDFVNRTLDRQAARPGPEAGPDALAAAGAEARTALMASGQGYRFLTENLETLQKVNEADAYERARGFGRAVVSGRSALPDYYRDHAPLTADITVPVLVIAGSRDHAVGPAEHERFRFPNAQMVVIDGGHLLYYENNAEFAGAVRAFFQRLEEGPDALP